MLASEPNRQLTGELELFTFRTFRHGPFASRTGIGTDASLKWTPHARLETRLDASYGRKPQGPRWVDTVEDVAVFSAQDPELLSLTLRQQLVFTPRLSAQLYAQLFSSAIRYDDQFYGASIAGRRHLSPNELSPIAYGGSPASHDALLRVHALAERAPGAERTGAARHRAVVAAGGADHRVAAREVVLLVGAFVMFARAGAVAC